MKSSVVPELTPEVVSEGWKILSGGSLSGLLVSFPDSCIRHDTELPTPLSVSLLLHFTSPRVSDPSPTSTLVPVKWSSGPGVPGPIFPIRHDPHVPTLGWEG